MIKFATRGESNKLFDNKFAFKRVIIFWGHCGFRVSYI